MFVVIFCCLVILFLFISKIILAVLFLPAASCNILFTNKFLRASGYIIWIIASIGLLISSVVFAYKLTPEILEYIK